MRGDILSPTQCVFLFALVSHPHHETGNLIWPSQWASTIFNRHSICLELSLRLSFSSNCAMAPLFIIAFLWPGVLLIFGWTVIWPMPSWCWGLCVTLALTIRLLSWPLNCFSGTDLALIFLLSIPLSNTQWRPLLHHVPFLFSTGQAMKNKSEHPYLGQG